MKTCSVEGCERPHQARGFCRVHYRAFRYWGKEEVWGRMEDRGVIQQHSKHGEGSIHRKGYRQYGHTSEHTIIAEKALGKKLPPEAVVHHLNENKADNTPTNLVICPNQEYHFLLHRRQQALEACGDPEAVRCRYCQNWGHPVRDNFYIGNGSTHHRACRNRVEREGRFSQ